MAKYLELFGPVVEMFGLVVIPLVLWRAEKQDRRMETLQKKFEEEIKYLNENFVRKDDHIRALGEIVGRLNDIFDKLDELTKSAAFHEGLEKGKAE